MIDFSFFFLVYEFFVYLLHLTIWDQYNSFHVIFFGGIVGISLMISSYLKKFVNPDKPRQLFHAFRIVAIFSFITWFNFVIFVYHHEITKLSERFSMWVLTDEGKISFLCFSFLIGLIYFILHFQQSEEPTKNSTLNHRQISIIIYITAWLTVAMFSLYIMSYSLFKALIIVLLISAEIISIFLIFYDPITFFASWFWKKEIKTAYDPTPNRLNRYAIIICAHNEETVISSLIYSLQNMSYPSDFYDIYAICDNCSDQTATVVRETGAIPMERFDEERRGKAFGLEWMFDLLEEKRLKGDIYDAYVVLDADNLVNTQFLDEINKELNEGNEILQAYLGSKNPEDTWVTKCYSLAYWISNLIYQNAHSKLGLSAQMGGTGMILRPSVLIDIGWSTGSLTEDLLLTTLYVKETGLPCHWVHKACLYDEKPLKIQASVVQRTRWMQGHMATFFQHGIPLLKEGFFELNLRKLDLALYLARPFMILLTFAIYMLRVIAVILFPETFIAFDFIMTAPIAFTTVFFYILMQIYALYKEGYLRYIPWIPLQWFYTYTWYLPAFRGILKHKELYWVSTEHKRNLSMDEVDEGTTE